MNTLRIVSRAVMPKLATVLFLAAGAVAFAQAPLTSLPARRFTVIDNTRYQNEIGTLSASGFAVTSTSTQNYSTVSTTPSLLDVSLVNRLPVVLTGEWDASASLSANSLSNYRRSAGRYDLPLSGVSGRLYYIVEWIGRRQVVADTLLVRRFEVVSSTTFRCRILRLSVAGVTEVSSMESPYSSVSTTPSLLDVQSADQQLVLNQAEINGLAALYGANYLANYRFSATTYDLPLDDYTAVSAYGSTRSYRIVQWVGGFSDTGVAASDAKPVNISTRLVVNQGGQGTMGFVITGTAPTTVLIRAVGPTLAAFGVAGTMVDPRLTVFQGATVVGTNDDWGSDASSALVASQLAAERGAFALGAGTRDAAKAFTLAPGAYTVAVQGANNAGGEVLMEVYF